MKITDFVNVFHGNGEIDLPKPYGIVNNWKPIKALSGNTSPAACLPFGKYPVSAAFNGKVLRNMQISNAEFMSGGELKFNY